MSIKSIYKVDYITTMSIYTVDYRHAQPDNMHLELHPMGLLAHIQRRMLERKLHPVQCWGSWAVAGGIVVHRLAPRLAGGSLGSLG
jgi:hypothetical protein